MRANIDSVKDIFSKMESNGFDTNQLLRWGFFFIASNKRNLESLFKELENHNYKVLYLKKTDTNEWTLKVYKDDILNYEKLHKRNLAFNDLADYCNVELYDGWDVELLN